MTTQPAAGRPLADRLSEGAGLSIADRLRIVRDVAAHVAELQAAGRIHREISASRVTVFGDGRAAIADSDEVILLGGDHVDNELIPPDLRHSCPWWLPRDRQQIVDLFQQSDITFEPRRVDLFQLSALMCRMFGGIPVDDYLRSPRAKSQVPPLIQKLIDYGIGLEPARRYVDGGELSRDLGLLSVSGAEVIENSAAPLDPRVKRSDSTSFPPSHETPVISSHGESASSQRDPVAPLPFKRLGHFQIAARIGSGGMGDVYKGFDESLQRTVAIKVLPPELARNQELIKRFYAEASAIAKLAHPNIIQIHFIGEDHGHHYFAMQYVQGESLGELLERKRRLNVEELLVISEQCLAGLAAAHARGLVHRDIKPGNILLDHQLGRALLADFGLAKALDGVGSITATGVIMGTLDYISPEQGRGLPVDGRSDLYSFGILMYQALSGRVPFEADTATAMLFKHAYDPPPPLSETAPDVPAELAEIVERLLAKAPVARYPDADTLLEELQAFRAGLSFLEHQPGRMRTVMFRAVKLPDPPAAAAELLATIGKKGCWGALHQIYQTFFRRHAPEFVKQLQGTQQQIDSVISVYERRVAQLESGIQQGESVLLDLNEQGHACEAAAGESSAEDVQAQHRRSAAELRQQAAEQENQLGLMRVNLAAARERLLNLRNQRDILNARLFTARAEAHLASGRRVRPHRPAWHWAVVSLLLAVVGLALGTIDTRLFVKSNQEPAPSAPPPSGVPVPVRFNPAYEKLPGIHKMRAPATCLTIASSWGPRRIAVGYADGQVGIYQGDAYLKNPAAKLYSEPTPIAVGSSPITSLAFSNNGLLLAAADADGALVVLDLKRKSVHRQLTGADKSLTALMFSADDQQLLAGGSSGLHSWNVTEGTKASTTAPSLSRRGVSSFALASGGREILIGANVEGKGAKSVAVMNALQNSEVEQFDTHEHKTTKVSFISSTAEYIGLVRQSGAVDFGFEVWKHGSHAPIRTFGKNLARADFSADGRFAVASNVNSNQFTLWDAAQGRELKSFIGHDGPLIDVAVARSGTWGVSIGSDDALRVWEFGLPADSLAVWDGLESSMGAVAYSRDSSVVTFAGRGGAQTGDFYSARPTVPNSKEIGAVAYAPDNVHSLFASGVPESADNEIIVRKHRNTFRTLRGHRGRINSAVFSNDSRRVISGSADGTIRIWEIQTEGELAQLNAGAAVNSVAIDPLGRPWCLSGGDENVARVWDMDQKMELRKFSGHDNVILSVAFTPDGQRVVTASADETIKIWDLQSGNQIQTLTGHSGRVNSIAVSNDGKYLVSGGDDGTVRQWDLATGKLERTYYGHWRAVRGVAIAPDRKSMASAGDDAMVRIWKLSGTTPSTGPTTTTDSATPAASSELSPPENLLANLSLDKASPKAGWGLKAGVLSTPKFEAGRLEILHPLVNAYELCLDVTRESGEEQLTLGFPINGSYTTFAFDALNGRVTGLERVKGVALSQGPNVWNGILLPQGVTQQIRCQIRGGVLEVWVNDRHVFEYRGGTKQLSVPDMYGQINRQAISLFTRAGSEFAISRFTLQPLPPGSYFYRPMPQDDLDKILAEADGVVREAVQPDFAKFQKMVWQAKSKIPNAQIRLAGDPLIWNKVRLNENNIYTTGIRFRSPLKVSADLCWAFTLPNYDIRWQITAETGKLEGFKNFWKEENCELPGTGQGLINQLFVQSLEGGQIAPGQEYLIWMTAPSPMPMDLQYSLQLTPAGTAGDLKTRDGISQALGLQLPLRYTDQIAPELRRDGAGKHLGVDCFAISPDGKRIIVSEQQNYRDTRRDEPYRLRVLNGRSLDLQRLILLPGQNPDKVRFAPDSTHALLSERGGTFLWWDIETGVEEYRFETDSNTPAALRFRAVPDQFVSAGTELSVWNVRQKVRLQNWPLPAPAVTECLELLLNDEEAVVGHTDGIVRVWNLTNGTESRRIDTGPIQALCVSPDQQYLATASADAPSIKLWNLNDSKLVREFRGHDCAVAALDFSSNGRRLLSASGRFGSRVPAYTGHVKFDSTEADHSVRLWDVASGTQLLRMDGHHQYVPFVEFNSDETEAIAASGDGTVRAWSLDVPAVVADLPTAEPTHILRGHRSTVDTLAVTADGKMLIAGGGTEEADSDTVIRLWDLDDHTLTGQFDQHRARIVDLSVSPNGKEITSTSADGISWTWNALTQAPIRSAHSRSTLFARYVNDSRVLCAGKGVMEYRVEGRPIHSFNMELGGLQSISMNADGSRVLTSSPGEAFLRLWDSKSGVTIAQLAGHSSNIESVALAGNLPLAISGGRDGTLRVWDTDRHRQIACHSPLAGPILEVALSADAKRALSAGQDGTVRLWDLGSQREIWRGKGHTGAVRCVIFSPDGRRAVSGGIDHLICVWTLPIPESMP